MSLHSYSRCWLHLIWGTLNRKRMLQKEAAARVSRYLSEYAESKGVYMKINYVNADHVHALIDLPTALSIENVVQLLKGSSSHWINANDITAAKFAWGRGYGAFAVSESNVNTVAAYIAGQEQHHRMRTFTDELKEFIERHGLCVTGLKAGVTDRIRRSITGLEACDEKMGRTDIGSEIGVTRPWRTCFINTGSSGRCTTRSR